MPKNIKIAITIILLMVCYSTCSSVANKGKELYNTSVSQRTQYAALLQKQVTTYDAYYLSFSEQYNIAGVTKEAFIQVTQIIMSGRTDGKNVAWKWVRENQQIPYDGFTSFYENLTQFVRERYKQLLVLEDNKQLIVQQNNELLYTFPNNLYNHFLHIQPLAYTYGYLSDSTKKLYNIK